ncbi:MAG TPA: mechanosensitive ion channel domain-containing protein [Gemmatimonadaceae bacterium]|jgi:small-conductance mechanosensitive channel
MKSKQNFAALALVVALAAAAVGLFETGRVRSMPPNPALDRLEQSDSVPTSDRSALETIQALAKLPTTADEVPLAQQALRIADKEMDLAFAAAVRRATLHPRPMSAEAKGIAAKLQQAQAELANDQADVTRLTANVAAATDATRGNLNDQLSLAQARLELAQDQADDAQQDLIRAGGDPQGRVQAMVAEHDAISKSSDSTRVVATAIVREDGLVHRATAWWALHQKQVTLARAKNAADSTAAAFVARHQALQTTADRASSTDTTNRRALSHDSARALVQRTVSRAADEKTRSTLDQRVEDQHQLSDVYAAWMGVVSAQQLAVINQALRGVAVILVIALIGLFFDKWLERLLRRVPMDHRSRQTMQTVIRVSLQVMGVLLTLLVIFGEPSNLGTFLGLAGAGLTVALKDFIVGFFGWFVLMGRNGIRIGDMVEINGVTGEVVELGMFHTVLLETGDWSDSGHPTGRRVTFMNSFAIEGHYFDFSTSSQWLWEEVQFVVPAGRDPYPIVDAIQHEVDDATRDKAKQAEEEWRRAAHSPSLGAITAAPAINIKPIVGGVEITVRYITHAAERHQLRSKLYHTAIELLGEASVVRTR